MAKCAFLFSGQASQYPGMGRELCSTSEAAARTFDEAGDALGIDMRALCWDSSSADLALTENTQPAILTVSVAQYRTIREREGLVPDVMAGHSLGEISALTAAGVLSLPDAVRIARLRGQLMQGAVPRGEGLMVALRTRDHELVGQVCREVQEETGEVVAVSNLNSHTQVVVAGAKKAVMSVHDRAVREEWSPALLNVSVPFHCALMEPVVAPLRAALEAIDLRDPEIPVLSNVTAEPYPSRDAVVDLLTRQVVETVRWVDVQRWLRMANTDYAVEVGPGTVLTKQMRHTYGQIPVYAYDTEEGVAGLRATIKRYIIPFVARALGVAAATRNTNGDEAAVREGIVLPYQRLRRLNNDILNAGREATEAEKRDSLDLLCTILDTKGIAPAEKQDRLSQLFRDTATEAEFADHVSSASV